MSERRRREPTGPHPDPMADALAELAAMSQELGLYDDAYGPCPDCGRWMKHYDGCPKMPPPTPPRSAR